MFGRKRWDDGRTYIFVDETGDMGKEPVWIGNRYSPSRVFAYGISIVKDPDGFSEISKDIRKKARDMEPWERDMIAAGVRKNKAKTYAVYIDKFKDVPRVWEDATGSDLQNSLLLYAVEYSLKKVKTNKITVVVDHHSAYGRYGESITSLSAPLSEKYKRDIECVMCGKRGGKYRDHLKSQDVVTYAVYDSKENGNLKTSRILKQKTNRLGKRHDLKI